MENLIDELVIKIFSYLPKTILLSKCCLVSRKWYAISQSPELWRDLEFNVKKLGLKRSLEEGNSLITDDIFTRITSLSAGITKVDLTNCRAISAGESCHSEKCKKLDIHMQKLTNSKSLLIKILDIFNSPIQSQSLKWSFAVLNCATSR